MCVCVCERERERERAPAFVGRAKKILHDILVYKEETHVKRIVFCAEGICLSLFLFCLFSCLVLSFFFPFVAPFFLSSSVNTYIDYIYEQTLDVE